MCVLYNNIIIIFIPYTFGTNKQKNFHCGAHSLIYKLSDCEVIERNPSIYFTIRILKDLSIKSYINGILIHVSQLHWIIGHTNNALSCWTQLFEIIKRYNVAPVPDIMSKSAFLADTIISFGCELEQEETFNFLAEQLRLFTVPPNRRRFFRGDFDTCVYIVS